MGLLIESAIVSIPYDRIHALATSEETGMLGGRGVFGTSRACFVAAIGSMPTFSTRWEILRTSPVRSSKRFGYEGPQGKSAARPRLMP